jgi:hypothetical protein
MDPIQSIGSLSWPAQLSANHRYLAAIQLRAVPIDLRQAVLDVLGQRLRAVDHGAERLHYGPLAYLKTLCAKAVAGQLVLPQQQNAVSAAHQHPIPSRDEDAKGRLLARLRVARGDHAHWRRVLGLEHRTDQQGAIGRLVEQAAAEVQRIEADLAALDVSAAGARSL